MTERPPWHHLALRAYVVWLIGALAFGVWQESIAAGVWLFASGSAAYDMAMLIQRGKK